MSKFSKEIQIALVAVVGLVVLFFGLQFLKGLKIFSSDSRYFVKFERGRIRRRYFDFRFD